MFNGLRTVVAVRPGTNIQAMIEPTINIGTAATKTKRHWAKSTINPPSTGPIVGPKTAV